MQKLAAPVRFRTRRAASAAAEAPPPNTKSGRRAKASLSALLDLGEKDQVVSYLSAMDERIRTKIITEFNREDPAVAADLLESIRTRATEMRAAGDPSG